MFFLSSFSVPFLSLFVILLVGGSSHFFFFRKVAFFCIIQDGALLKNEGNWLASRTGPRPPKPTFFDPNHFSGPRAGGGRLQRQHALQVERHQDPGAAEPARGAARTRGRSFAPAEPDRQHDP
jgi:hypothetical protein